MADSHLDGLLALITGHDEPLLFETPSEPHQATRRLMDALGVEVRVTAVSAHEATLTRDCAFGMCDQVAEHGDYCRVHVGQARNGTRAEKFEAIRRIRLERPELTDAQRAELLGMSISAYRNLLYDPDGARQSALRATYSGVCERCGGETKSNGTSRASRVCADCSRQAMRESRVWTRESIITAIQRWASEHDGMPPPATAWNHRDRPDWAPPTSSVFRTKSSPNSPFETWNEALTAAGFQTHMEHTRRGRWTRERCITAVKRFAREQGRPPIIEDTYGHPYLPSQPSAKKHCGSWADLIEAAGFPRPVRGRNQTSGREPSGPAAAAAAEAQGLTTSVEPPGSDDPVAPPTTAAGTAERGSRPEVRDAPPAAELSLRELLVVALRGAADALEAAQ